MNQAEPRPNKSASKWIAVAIIVVFIVIAGFVLLNNVIPAVNAPHPEITLVDGHGGLQGFDYVHYVDVKVTNSGGEGWIKVYAEINGPRYEEQNQRIYMDKDETKQLQFTFDLGILDSMSSVTSKAWAMPD